MVPTYLATLVLGVALVAVARWAGRRRGTRWESFVALRVSDVLVTEVAGAFLIGLSLGNLIAPAEPQVGRPGPPRPPGRFGIGGITLPVGLGLLGALIAALAHVDLGNVFLGGRATRNPLATYIGWDALVVAAIPAGGFGQITMRDGIGNVMSIAATADRDIAAETVVRITAVRDLNVVVSPLTG